MVRVPIVGQDLNVSLLEFNSGPDLKMTGARLDYVIQSMTAGMADLVLASGAFPSLLTTPAPTPAVVQLESDGVTRVDGSPEPTSRLQWDLVYDDAWPMAQGGPTMAFQ